MVSNYKWLISTSRFAMIVMKMETCKCKWHEIQIKIQRKNQIVE